MASVLKVVCLFGLVHISSAWFSGEAPPNYNHGVNLPTKRPLIIAHRGTSGMLPEHTVQAYRLAIEQGADVIECDVAMTRDLQMVCFHDNWLNDTTNVAELFPGRFKTYFLPDRNQNRTDYFTVDFTLKELKTLRIKQRFSFRDKKYDGKYTIPTLEEYIAVAMGTSGRTVGIYPETKQPVWVNSLDFVKSANTTFERLLVDVLNKHGFNKSTDPCFLQSFRRESLDALRELTSLPLVYLIGDTIPTESDIQAWSKVYYGLGFNKNLIVQIGGDGWISKITDVVTQAHRYGLRIHPYTFRNEDRYLAWDYGQDPYNELRKFLDIGIDGYFTDFTGTCSDFLTAVYSGKTGNVSSGATSFCSFTNVVETILCLLVALVAVRNIYTPFRRY